MKAINIRKYNLIDKGKGYILAGKNGRGYFGVWIDPEDIIAYDENFIVVEDFLGENLKEYVEVIDLPDTEREKINNVFSLLSVMEDRGGF